MDINNKYTELLILIAPGPLGQGFTLKEAANKLNIPYRTVQDRLVSFKKKYPDAWANFDKLRKEAKDRRYKLMWKRHPNQQVGMKTECDTYGKRKRPYKI